LARPVDETCRQVVTQTAPRPPSTVARVRVPTSSRAAARRTRCKGARVQSGSSEYYALQ